MTISIGEGSRGGHVIGHTRSGKPIYGAPKDVSHILGSVKGGHLVAEKSDVTLLAQAATAAAGRASHAARMSGGKATLHDRARSLHLIAASLHDQAAWQPTGARFRTSSHHSLMAQSHRESAILHAISAG